MRWTSPQSESDSLSLIRSRRESATAPRVPESLENVPEGGGVRNAFRRSLEEDPLGGVHTQTQVGVSDSVESLALPRCVCGQRSAPESESPNGQVRDLSVSFRVNYGAF